MSLKHNPFAIKQHPLTAISDHFFNGSIADFIGSDFVNSQPSVNITETEKEFKIDLAAPGLEKKDFVINVEKDQLTISVEKKKEETAENERFTRREFTYHSFERSFNLSKNVNKEGILAAYENGILSITLPKNEAAQAEAKRVIEIS